MNAEGALRRLLEGGAGAVDVVWRAPGRANLIGEHTDYNQGFVLPVALEMATYVAGGAGDTIRLESLEEEGAAEVDPTTGRGPGKGWGAYVSGVVRALHDDGVEVAGFEGRIASDVPIGAGLSSSAALEVAVARAVAGAELDPSRLAQICRRAENDYVGMRCGIMDQMASAAAREDHALLIDCRDDSVEHIPFPRDLRVLLIDSGTSRELSGSGYNERHAECEAAAAALGVASLRDATEAMVEASDLHEPLKSRARHVVSENARVAKAAEALAAGSIEDLAGLFAESHRSYSADFEASTPEIDRLVEIASGTDGVLGSRLTGGGFGGCTVNLVAADEAEAVAAAVTEGYERDTGIRARWWVSRAAAGAARIEP